MEFFNDTREIQSLRNGSIISRRRFLQRGIYVDGYDQTSPYTNTMWRQALRRIPVAATPSVKRILLLGLGGGGIVPILLERFSSSRVTAVDWDQIMIQITVQSLSYKVRDRITILNGDAGDIVSTLIDQFDLIICDLFTGGTVAPCMGDPIFLRALLSKCHPRGYILFNAFHETKYLETLQSHCSFVSSWQYRYNTIGFFRKQGSGVAGDPLPDGYMNYRCCPEYMQREVSANKKTRIVQTNGAYGYRSDYLLFTIERYISDCEPIIANDARKLVVWRTLTRMDHPKGWIRAKAIGGIGLTGFADLQEAGEEYWISWTSHAQRHRRKWQVQKEWHAQPLSPAEFIQSYWRIRKDPSLKALFIGMLKKKIKAHGERVHLIGICNQKTGEIGGGFAWLDVPEISQSTHLISFIHRRARKEPIGVGLMNEWFVYGQKAGIRFLDFGLYWSPGEPRAWRAFSNFKSQFGIRYLRFPTPMMRFVGKAR